MAAIFFMLGVINILVYNGFGMEIPPKIIDINIKDDNEIPMEAVTHDEIKNNMLREKRHSSYNRWSKKNITITNHNSTINGGNKRMNNNVTRNNPNFRNNGRNGTHRNSGTIWTNRINGTTHSRCNGIHIAINNTTSNGYPKYLSSEYTPTTKRYILIPSVKRNSSNATSQYWGQNIYNNSSRPGNNINNTRFGFNKNYSSTPNPFRQGNDTLPFQNLNTGYLRILPNNPKLSHNYNNTGRLPIPGYGPSINGSVQFNNKPISSANIATYKPDNVTVLNGNTSVSCNRCKNAVVGHNSTTINKEEATMDACVVICNDCPAGMKRVGAYCVPESDPDDEE